MWRWNNNICPCLRSRKLNKWHSFNWHIGECSIQKLLATNAPPPSQYLCFCYAHNRSDTCRYSIRQPTHQLPAREKKDRAITESSGGAFTRFLFNRWCNIHTFITIRRFAWVGRLFEFSPHPTQVQVYHIYRAQANAWRQPLASLYIFYSHRCLTASWIMLSAAVTPTRVPPFFSLSPKSKYP